MSILNCQSLQSGFNEIRACLISKSTEWTSRIVAKIQLAQPYLKDPRIASAVVFGTNFVILMLASRINQFASLYLPEQTVIQKRLKLALQATLFCGLIVAGNTVFIKATGIVLNRLILAAIITTAFIAKYNLDSYLKQLK